MKWISADYIKVLMKSDRLMQGNAEYELWKQEVDKKVDAMPFIDIVRCSECGLNETDGCPMAYCTPLEDGDFETRWWNSPDDFCSWGEREGE